MNKPVRFARMAAALLAAGTLAGAVAACGSDSDSSSTGESAATTSQTTAATTSSTEATGTETTANLNEGAPATIGNPDASALCKNGTDKDAYRIGWEAFSATQEWIAQVTESMKKLADELGCVTIIAAVDNGDGPTAVNNVRSMISQDIDALITCTSSANPNTAIAKMAKEADIPVVSTCSETPDAVYMNLSNYQSGYDSGKALAEAAKEQYPDHPEPYLLNAVCKVCGESGLQQEKGTLDAFKEVFPDLPESHILTVETDSTQKPAYENALSLLSRVPEGELILTTGNTSDVVYGVHQAAKSRNRKPLLAEDAGGSGFALELVCKDPQYVGSISSRGDLWPNYTLPAAIELVNGTELPKKMTIPTYKYTKDNVPDCDN